MKYHFGFLLICESFHLETLWLRHQMINEFNPERTRELIAYLKNNFELKSKQNKPIKINIGI